MSSKRLSRAAFGAIGAAAMLLAGAVQAAGVPGQGTWETTLLPRDLDGNAVNGPEAFYDTTLNVTWLRDADVNGRIDWNTAVAWAAGLDVGGVKGWRLPTMIDTGAPGCDFFSYAGGTDCGYNVQTKSGDPTNYEPGQTVYSEMAHLFYVSLGNKAYCPSGDATCAGGPQPGWGLSNTGNFQNLQAYDYWSGLEVAPYPYDSWYFHTNDGYQAGSLKINEFYAMVVRPGDVAVVPEPQTYALLLLGLTGLAVARRQQRR